MIFQLGKAAETPIYEKNDRQAFLSSSIEELKYCLEHQHIFNI